MTTVRPPIVDLQPTPRWRAVFLVVIALLLVSGGLALHQYFRYSVASNANERTHQVLSSLDGLLSRLLDAETGARGYLLTGSEPFLEPYNQAEPRVATASAELVALVEGDPLQRERVRRLADLSQSRALELRTAVETFKAGRTTEAVERIASGVGQRLMD